MVTNTKTLAYYYINSIYIRIKYWKYCKEDVTCGWIVYGTKCFKNVSNFWYAKITFYLQIFSDQMLFIFQCHINWASLAAKMAIFFNKGLRYSGPLISCKILAVSAC
jgi:hypothetical protein